MSKTRAKKLPSKRIICISAFMLGIVMLALGVTYAWFRNTIDLSGINMQTGTFKYQFAVYSADSETETIQKDGQEITRKKLNNVDAYSTEAKQNDNSGFKPIPDGKGLVVTSVKTDIKVSTNEKGEIFFVVKKLPGSVDLDVSISLEAALDDLLKFDEKIEEDTPEAVAEGETGTEGTTPSDDDVKEILGGFWYSIDNITGNAGALADVENILRDEGNFKATSKEDYFPDIRNEIQDARLDDHDYWVFRLCYGLHSPAVLGDYLSRELSLAADLCVAQVGGLEGQSPVNVHRVKTLDRLRTALLEYKPNDKIVVEGDITYEGDLIINRPLALEIINSTLTVKGNMRFIYASNGKFKIDTSTSGHLKVIEMGDGIDAGGNLYCDIPDSSLEINGHNSTTPGMADIYIENDFSVDVGYDEGMYITRSRICNLTSETLKTIIVRNQSYIDVATRTTVGAIIAPNSQEVNVQATRIKIRNEGTIEEINLTFMVRLFDGTAFNPVILIDNYGNIERDGTPTPIVLPTWAKVWRQDNPRNDPNKNTQIIHRQGAGFMSTTGATGEGAFISDGSQIPERDHIEYPSRGTIVDKLDTDGTKIVVHYMEDKIFATTDAEGKVSYENLTLENIIKYYQSEDCPQNQRIADTNKIVYLEVKCYGNYALTDSDYAVIRSMEALTSLNLANASSAKNDHDQNTVPDRALAGLQHLYDVKMSDNDEIWGEDIFDGCVLLEELRLPNTLTKLSPSSISKIKYLHLGTLEELVCVDGTDWQNKYLFCANTDTKDNIISIIWNSNDYRVLGAGAPDAEKLAQISKVFFDATRYGKYFAVLSDDGCQIMTYVEDTYTEIKDNQNYIYENQQFVASREKEKYTLKNKYDTDAHDYAFDFEFFTIDGHKYPITQYADYAFFKKGIDTAFGNTLEFHENLYSVGDGAFYNTNLPKNVNLGKCEYIGHAALTGNANIRILEGPYVEELGYWACGNLGSNIKFINFPRAIWCYGAPFGGGNGYPVRLDIGMLQKHSTALAVGDNAALFAGNAKVNTSNDAINTLLYHTVNAPENITLLPIGKDPKAIYIESDYAQYVSAGTASVEHQDAIIRPLEKYTAEEIVSVVEEGHEYGAYLYIPLDDEKSEYSLIRCLKPSINMAGEEYVVPSYVDKSGVTHKTTTIGRGAFDQTKISADTLTFTEDVTRIERFAFFGYKGSDYDNIDLKNVTYVGERGFAKSKAVNLIGTQVVAADQRAFGHMDSLVTASLINLSQADYVFYNCPFLEMAAIGPIYGEHIFGGTTQSSLKKLFVNVTGIDQYNKPSRPAYLFGGSGVVPETLSIVSIGGEFNWEMSKNSPYKANVVDPYNMTIIEEGVESIRFSDWVEKNVTLNGRTQTIYNPTFLYAVQSEDSSTISLELQFDFVNTATDFVVPDRLYKAEGTQITTILGTVTDRYTYVVPATESEALANRAGLQVVEIGDGAFDGKLKVNSVTFPESLKRIGKNAFANCSFESTEHPININVNRSGVEELIIDEKAFNETIFGSDVTITLNNTLVQKTSIAKEAFNGAKFGELSIVGNGGLIIDNKAFYESVMSSLDLDGVVSIGESAFYGIEGHTEKEDQKTFIEVSLGGGLATTTNYDGTMFGRIGKSAFEQACLSKITANHSDVEKKNLAIGERAFAIVAKPEGIEFAINGVYVTAEKNAFANGVFTTFEMKDMWEIKPEAFNKVTILTKLDLSDSQGTIQPLGFSNKSNIAKVELGNGTKLKGDYIIGTSASATTIRSDNVIYRGAFNDCTIGTFNFNNAAHPDSLAFVSCTFENIDFGSFTSLSIDPNQMGIGATEHQNANDDRYTWRDENGNAISNFEYTVHIFRDCKNLGNVNLRGIKTLGNYAFSSCATSEITDKNILVIESIKQGTDIDNQELKLLKNVNSYAFNGVKVNSTLHFTTGVTFANNATRNLSISGGDLIIGDDSSIGDSAFYGVKLPLTDTELNNGKISNLTIGERATVGNNAFYKLNMTKGDLTIGNETGIGEKAFYDATLTNGNITIGSGTEEKYLTIGASAFDTAKAELGKLEIGSYITTNYSNKRGSFSSIRVKSLQVGNNIDLNNYAFNYSAKIYGDAIFGDNVSAFAYIFSGVNISGDLEIGDNFSVANNGYLMDASAKITGDLIIGDNANLARDFADRSTISGDFIIGKSAIFGPDTDLITKITVKGNLTIGDSATLNANTLTGNTIEGDVTLGMSTMVKESAFSNTKIGSIDVETGEFKTQGNLTIGKNSTINQKAFENLQIYNGNLVINVETSIGTEAFINLKMNKGNLSIDEGIHIGERAFHSAILSAGYITIGESASIDINAFGELNIYNGNLVINDATTIGNEAFINLKMTKGDLTIGDETGIGEKAFQSAVLTNGNITIGSGSEEKNLTIGYQAFYGVQATLGKLTIGDYVETKLGTVEGTTYAQAFEKLKIGSVKIGDNVTLGTSSFNQADVLSGDMIFGNDASLSKNSLSSIEISGNLIFGERINPKASPVMGGTVTIGGNLEFGASGIFDYDFSGTVRVTGDLKIGANTQFTVQAALSGITAQNVVIGENATFTREALSHSTIKGNFTVGDNAAMDSTYTFLNTSVGGTFSIGSFTSKQKTYPFFASNSSNYVGKLINKISFRETFDGTIDGSYFANIVINEVDLSNVTEIGSGAFGASKITNIVNTEGVTTIGPVAFGYYSESGVFNYNLSSSHTPEIKTSVSFPNVTTVGERAFRNCIISGTITAGNVKTLGNYAFYNSTLNGNATIIGDAANKMTVGEEAFNAADVTGTLTLENISTLAKRSMDLDSATAGVIIDNVDTIKSNAFAGGNMASLSINNVNIIESGAFAAIDAESVAGLNVSGSMSITGVSGATIGAGTAIGNGAFYKTTIGRIVEGSLRGGLTINRIATIPNFTFKNATINGNVILGNSTTMIMMNSFASATIAGNISGAEVNNINGSAFINSAIGTEGISGTGDVNFENLKTINTGVFKGAIIRGNVDISKVAYLNDLTFQGATVDGTIKLDSVSKIGASAFENSTLAKSLVFKSNVTEVGKMAFSGFVAEDGVGVTFEGNLTIADFDVADDEEGAFCDVYLDHLIVNGVANIGKGAAKFFKTNNNKTSRVSIGTLSFNGGSIIGEKAFTGAEIGPATFGGATVVNAFAFDGAALGATTFNGGAEFGKNAFAGATVNGSLTFNSGAELGLHACYKDGGTGENGDKDDIYKKIVINGDLNFHADADIGRAAFDMAEINGDIWFYDEADASNLRTNVATIGIYAFMNSTIKGDIHFAAGTIGQQAFESAKIGLKADPAAGTVATGHIWLGNLTSIHGGSAQGQNSYYELGAFHSAEINGGVNFENASGINFCAFAKVSHIPYVNTGNIKKFGRLQSEGDRPHQHDSGYSVFSGIGSIGRLEMPNVETIGKGTFTRITIDYIAPFENLSTVAGLAFGHGTKIKSDLIFNKHITINGSSSHPVFYGSSYSGGKTSFSGDVIFAGGLTTGTRDTFSDVSIGGDLRMKYLNLMSTDDIGYKDALLTAVTVTGALIIDEGDVIGIISRGSSKLGGISFPEDGRNRILAAYENNLSYTSGFNSDSISGRVDLSGVSEITNAFFSTVKFATGTVIELPKVTNIGAGAFKNTTNIANVNSPLVKTIGEEAFSGCTLLKAIDMTSVNTIGASAFKGCSSLTDVYAPSLVTVDANAFLGCRNILNVDAPVLKTIKNNAFEGCTSLTRVQAPSLTTLATQAFKGCTGIASVYVPMLETIDSGAFEGCTSLAIIELPSLVAFGSYDATDPAKINNGNSPFVGCTGLKTVIIGDKLKTWGNGAFAIGEGNTLQKIVLATPVSQIDSKSFVMIPSELVKVSMRDYLEEGYLAKINAEPEKIIFGGNIENKYGIKEIMLQDYHFEYVVESGNGNKAIRVIYYAKIISDLKVEIIDMDIDQLPNNTSEFTFPSQFANVTIDGVTKTYTVVSVGADAMLALKANGNVSGKENANGITIVLPDDLEFINFDGRDVHVDTAKYQISASNVNFTTVDGILYSKDGGMLVLCPPYKKPDGGGNLTISGSNGMIIGPNAFAGLNSSVTKLTFNCSLIVGDDAFRGCGSLTDIYLAGDDADTHTIFIGRNVFTGCRDDLKIHVPNETEAAKYVIYDTTIIDRFVSP